MFSSENVLFNEIGYIKIKLDSKVLKKLNTYIKNKTTNTNKILAGNISGSYNLIDKDNYFFNNVLTPLIIKYNNEFGPTSPITLTKNCAYVLDRFWVNFQKKYEFNPIHHHSGVWSFVIWIQIPSSYKKEIELPFIKHANSPLPNTFQFITVDGVGKITTYQQKLEPSDKGTMLFFPAQLNHCVYPFYLSNKQRISISGNISLDPTQIIQ